mgnify:CR=1 FL=1
MANQVRIEYDPYQQKASYQIRDSSSRKFAKIPKSDLGNPDNHKYHDGMLDEILKYAIPELQEKRLAKELVFCGTEDDFQDFKDALVRFYERNPDTTWNMTLLRDETSYHFEGIPFSHGEANFSEVGKGSVEIEDFSDDRGANFDQADEALALQRGCAPEEVAQWRKENHYTWHECNDCKTMQKVPSEVHGNIPHSGGISVYKAANLQDGGTI